MNALPVHTVIIGARVAIVKHTGRSKDTIPCNTGIIRAGIVVITYLRWAHTLTIDAKVICTGIRIRAVARLEDTCPVYATVNCAQIIIITDNWREGAKSVRTQVFRTGIEVITFGRIFTSARNTDIVRTRIAIITRNGNSYRITAISIVCNNDMIICNGNSLPVDAGTLRVIPGLIKIFEQTVIQISNPLSFTCKCSYVCCNSSFVTPEHLHLRIINLNTAGWSTGNGKRCSRCATPVISCYNSVITGSKPVKIHL